MTIQPISGASRLLCCLLGAFIWACAPAAEEQTAVAETTTTATTPQDSLKVCLLNYYEPLSDETRGGIFEEYATYLAERMDRVPAFVYLNAAYFNRPVRDGIRKGICDCQMGHPIEEDEPWLIPNKVRQSKAYTAIGYAIATADPAIQSLTDLDGKRVIIMPQSPPMTVVSDLDSVRLQFMIDEPRMMQSLASGEVDAVVAWGPKLYHLNKTEYGNTFRVFDTSFMWDVAILTQAKDSALMEQINAIIREEPDKYGTIAAAYGL